MKTKTEIYPTALYWASFNRFDLRLPGECVIECTHSGPCDNDVSNWTPKVMEQMKVDNFPRQPTAEKIRAELEEYGAWDAGELADDEKNWQRLVWIAAGNIAEDETPDCSEPVATIKIN